MVRGNLRHGLKGFSLVEMMFVIVIIGIITAVTVNILRSKLTNSLVEKAASQMELILQAQSAYYSDNQNTAATDLSQLQNYLTLPSTTNPWGLAYTLTPPADTPPDTLTLTTTVPTANIALELVGLLPNANCAGSPPNCNVASPQVTASIPMSQTGKFIFNSSYRAIYWPTPNGSSSANYSFSPTACPSNYLLYVNAYLDINPLAEYPDSSGPVSNTTVPVAGNNTFYVNPYVNGQITYSHYGSLEIFPVSGFKTQGGGPICVFGGSSGIPSCDQIGNNFNINVFYTISNSFFADTFMQSDKNNSNDIVLPGSSGGKYNMIMPQGQGTTPNGLGIYDIFPLTAYNSAGGLLMGTNNNGTLSLSQVDSATCNYLDPDTHSCPSARRDPQGGFIGYLTVQQWCQPPSAGNSQN